MTSRIPELNLRRSPEMFKIIPDDLIQRDEDVLVISPDHIADVFDVEVELENGPGIDPQHWITAEYAPLPSLIQAARTIRDKEPLPQIKRALSAGISA
jgi:hypothetical protein